MATDIAYMQIDFCAYASFSLLILPESGRQILSLRAVSMSVESIALRVEGALTFRFHLTLEIPPFPISQNSVKSSPTQAKF